GGFATNNGLVFSTNLLLQATYLAASLNLVTASNTNQSVTAPAIVSGPVSQNIVNGQSASFFVTVTGTHPLAYQWRFDSTNLPGATSSSLTLVNAQTNQAGSYTVVVTNSAGAAVSSVAL